MIDALIAGKLYGAPASRTAKSGNPYATAKVRVPVAEGRSEFVNVIAFSTTAVAALLALADGDSVALSGELTVGTYQAKDGATRVSFDLKAHAVLTAYHVRRKRQAVRGEDDAAGAPAPADTGEPPAAETGHTDPEFNDGVPF